jgi:TetR/AcrR family transcriptional regulator, transcriptional repressor for nem operon
MRTPEITKQTILRHAGMLFNTKGYKATSISDITSATKLTKGAVYRHFEDKENLESQSFEHIMQIISNKFTEAVQSQKTAPLKLNALFSFFKNYVTNSPIVGGCPLLNAAIEADDANPNLKMQALKYLQMFEQAFVHIIENGIKHKQLKANTDAANLATLFIASLEGGIMMSKLHNNNKPINQVLHYLQKIIRDISI